MAGIGFLWGKFRKGQKATIPQLEAGQPGFANDAGAEELYIGNEAGNANVLVGAWDVLRKTVGGNISANVTMTTGASLTLDHDPLNAMEAATKQYVDSTSGAVELTWDEDLRAMLCVK